MGLLSTHNNGLLYLSVTQRWHIYGSTRFICILIQCFQVKCLTDKLVLNQANFDWNQSEFSTRFKSATNASEFITIWQKITEVADHGYAVPKESLEEEQSHVAVTEVLSQGEQEKSDNEGSILPPSSKRPRLMDNQHQNPIDISIEGKRVGKCVTMHIPKLSTYLFYL